MCVIIFANVFHVNLSNKRLLNLNLNLARISATCDFLSTDLISNFIRVRDLLTCVSFPVGLSGPGGCDHVTCVLGWIASIMYQQHTVIPANIWCINRNESDSKRHCPTQLVAHYNRLSQMLMVSLPASPDHQQTWYSLDKLVLIFIKDEFQLPGPFRCKIQICKFWKTSKATGRLGIWDIITFSPVHRQAITQKMYKLPLLYSSV